MSTTNRTGHGTIGAVLAVAAIAIWPAAEQVSATSSDCDYGASALVWTRSQHGVDQATDMELPLTRCDYNGPVAAAVDAAGINYAVEGEHGDVCAFTDTVVQGVKEFQAEHNLQVTGEIDQATWDAMDIGRQWWGRSGDFNGNGVVDIEEISQTSCALDSLADAVDNPPAAASGVDCDMTATATSSHMSCSGDGVYLSARCYMIGDTMHCTSHSNLDD